MIFLVVETYVRKEIVGQKFICNLLAHILCLYIVKGNTKEIVWNEKWYKCMH